MTAARIAAHLQWMRDAGQSEYVDDPQRGARRWYLELLGQYLAAQK